MDSTINIQITDEQKGSIQEIEDTQDKEIVQAGEFAIESQEDLKDAREFVKHLKMRIKKINGTFGEVRDANHKAWKASIALENKFLDPIEAAIKGITSKANIFLDAEEKKRLEEEERLRKVAEKEAERLQRALIKKIDKLFEKVKDDAGQLKVLEDMLIETLPESPEYTIIGSKIDILECKIEGAITKAEAHKEAAEPAPSFVQPSVAPVEKVKGVTSKMKRVGTVVDKLALIKAVANGDLHSDILEVKQANINTLVKSGIASIPGVSITEERDTSFR